MSSPRYLLLQPPRCQAGKSPGGTAQGVGPLKGVDRGTGMTDPARVIFALQIAHQLDVGIVARAIVSVLL